MSLFQNSVDKLVQSEQEKLQQQKQKEIEELIESGQIVPMTECAYGQSVADLETNKIK